MSREDIDPLAPSESSPRRPVIEHSWRRSALSGVRPDDATPTTLVDIASTALGTPAEIRGGIAINSREH